jgi:protein-S-isoprenylcysteine O-methyltransferase Ste14
MEAVEHFNTELRPPHPSVTTDGLKHAAANLVLATSFFVAALPAANSHHTSLANSVWIVGAIVMGVFSLIRIPPRTVMINLRSISATAGMLMLPCLMRPGVASVGLFATAGLAFELIGVVATQVARIYMGRSFGLLPANRGIVTHGPFAMVRHPIYMGWLTMSAGYALSFPSVRNMLLVAVAVPFMMWRIEQEEQLLTDDPDFVAYCERVPCQLVPGLI